MPERDHLVQAGRWTDKHVHEGHDTQVRTVFWIAMGLLVMVVLSGLVAALMMGMMGIPDYRAQPRLPVPEPHLLADPLKDIARQRQEKEAMLRGYAWIDRSRGIVHIPLGAAMAALAQTPMGLRPGGGDGGQP